MVTYNQPGVQYNEGRYNAVTVVASASGVLGGLVAVADATPVPPAPSPTPLPGGVPYRQPRRIKKREPEPVLEVVEPVVEPVVVEAFVTPLVIGMSASAVGLITFSAEEDDLQVLLML
jgi:hypothetical protein